MAEKTTRNQPYHYDYRQLDAFLSKDYDPQSVGRELDEIMADLVHLVSKDEDFARTLRERHYLLRELRDIFWKLSKAEG